MLSIIIPTDSNEPNSYFHKTLESFSLKDDLEIIFISKSEANTRAERLNLGFHCAKGKIILFHHPRSFIEKEGINYLIELSKTQNKENIWGGFTHKFDQDHYLLRFTSWYSNTIRARLKGILYLDHCIFFDRSLWKRDLPNIEIFEDTILSNYLRETCTPIILPYISETSSIRFQKNGIWKQSILNQILKIGYYTKFNPSIMNRIYEKNLGLNNDYKAKLTQENKNQ
ncbi:MAG: hypothetical protein SFU98_08175 [Leptospiraceae bacterium]|nr:hypothetical protein [Leptospiraceae bacterium]